MKIVQFEDIIAWQKAKELTLMIYKTFKLNRDYGFKDQIQRASVSIMNNIAEGFDRRGDKEFKHFLYIANGSCAETKSMSYIAKELHYVTEKQFNDIQDLTNNISKAISGFIRSLRLSTED